MNNFMITGKCVNTPEIKKTANGYNYAHLLIKDEKPNQEGSSSYETLQVILWGSLADDASKNAKEGSLVSIRGRISDSSFEKDSEMIYRNELVAERIRYFD